MPIWDYNEHNSTASASPTITLLLITALVVSRRKK